MGSRPGGFSRAGWRAARLATTLAIAGALAACGSTGSPPPSGATSSTGPPPASTIGSADGGSSTSAAAPSADVGSSSPVRLSPGDHSMAVVVGGLRRTFTLRVPPAPTGRGEPLVLVFHGAGDTAAATEIETDLAQVGDARGELVAYLQGYQNTWNEGAGHTPAEQAGVDDVAFTAAVLAAVRSVAPVEDSRVAAVGFSNGALLVEYLGCRLAASLTLIVPVAGPLPVSVAAGCAPSRPVSVLAVHGTADQSIPYGGGAFAGVGGGATVLSAAASIARWATLDGCAGAPASSASGSARLTVYHGCRDGVGVTLRSLVGAGHAWPADIGEQVAEALG